MNTNASWPLSTPASARPIPWLFLFVIFFAVLFASTGFGASLRTITLEWDRNSETNVAGYRVYVGVQSRGYSSTIDALNQTSASVPNLQPGSTYYFAVTAYTSDGLESDFSDEVFYLVPGGAPVVQNDSYSTAQGTALNVNSPGVMSNDSDPDGNATTSSLVSTTLHGTLTFRTDGSFTYVPATGYSGADAFTYTINNGTLSSAIATVVLNVTAVNRTPVAQAESYSTTQQVALAISAPGVLANDSDPDGNSINAVLVAQPAHGTLTLNANGSFTYVPAAGYFGSDAFTYSARDGSLTSPAATVTLNIARANRAPVSQPDSYSTTQQVALVIGAPGVLANDSDPDSDAITAVIVSQPAHGTVSLNANGSFSYVPAAGYSGSDAFSYAARDASLTSAAGTVTINVVRANRVPVSQPDSYSTTQQVALVIGAPGVLANDSDPDSDTITAIIVSQPSHGTVTLNGSGSFTYVPATGYSGGDSFSYSAKDASLTSPASTVSINVVRANRAPVSQPESYSTTQQVALVIGAPGVLANDSDPDSDTITAIIVSQPSHGTVTLNGNGSFTYVPTTGYSGGDSFSYSAKDASLTSPASTVNINVVRANRAPVSQPDTYSTTQQVALVIGAPGLLANDSDPDSDAITAVIVSQPSHGAVTLNANGSFTYVPATGYFGSDAFSYSAKDASLTSPASSVTINVARANRAPASQPESYSTTQDVTLAVSAPGVLANDSDPDGNTITAVIASQPAHGTLSLNANGSFTYVPLAGYVGADSFTYSANDAALTSPASTVSINVSRANRAPVTQPDSYSTTQQVALVISAPGVLGNDSDPDGDTVTALLVSQPAHGSVSLNANGSFNYVPTAGYHGTDAFSYKASDGSMTSSVATVSLNIGSANRAPLAQADSFVATQQVALAVSAPGVLANDSDPDGNVVTAVLLSGPLHGTLALNANGSFSYVPAAGYSGSDTFSYAATDGSLNSSAAVVTLTVLPKGVAPTAVADSYTTTQRVTLNIAAPGVLGNDTDADGDAITAIVLSTPFHGGVALRNSGAFAYVPDPAFSGTDSFTYTASDGARTSAVVTVTITVVRANNAPVANADSFSGMQNTTINIAAPGVLGNDSDSDGDSMTAALASPAQHGSITLNANGSFSYVPNIGYAGVDAFSYVARDGMATSAPVTVTFTLTADPNAVTSSADSYAAFKNIKLNIPAAAGVLTNDSAPAGSTLSARIATTPFNGSITFSNDGSFIYLPNTDFIGEDHFTYRVTDGRMTSQVAVVTIVVTDQASLPSPCEGCFAELDARLAARGNDFPKLLAARTQVPANVSCLNAGLSVLFAVAKAANLSGDSLSVAAVGTAAVCIRSNLQAAIADEGAIVDSMMPSRWSVKASNDLARVETQLSHMNTAADPLTQARALKAIGTLLTRVDVDIAKGTPMPRSLASRVLQCTFTKPKPASQAVIQFDSNRFQISGADGTTLASGQYQFTPETWNTGTLTLNYEAGGTETYSALFSPGHSRLTGSERSGSFAMH